MMKKGLICVLGAILGIAAGAALWLQGTFGEERAAAIGIIGGADGPTSIFIAGKIGRPSVWEVIAAAAVAAAVIYLVWRLRKGKKDDV